MKEIQIFSLLCITGAALLSDLREGIIPNAVVTVGLLWGLSYQGMTKGAAGILVYLGGALLPILLFGGFYYFRMIGAGDIKLMCTIGGFLGPSACFACISATIFIGGVISAGIMLRSHSFLCRLFCFAEYIRTYSKEMEWKPYLDDTPQDARFCFSIAVFLGTLCYIGGLI
ncbi:MAG: prepilin peptidase [Lachnospiraceae bacterium]|uniref:A24 family peptidase n=1 Tax=Parablautia sp. Marseille-Q6255 TaxID=3039593 RepID=UPI0024BD3291|nr:prepilin peptidase [Parablautia sp. Marseille-Q6255]